MALLEALHTHIRVFDSIMAAFALEAWSSHWI